MLIVSVLLSFLGKEERVAGTQNISHQKTQWSGYMGESERERGAKGPIIHFGQQDLWLAIFSSSWRNGQVRFQRGFCLEGLFFLLEVLLHASKDLLWKAVSASATTCSVPLQSNLVVANILPPMFSLTQSFLDGASGVGTKAVAFRPKSPGSSVLVDCGIGGGLDTGGG